MSEQAHSGDASVKAPKKAIAYLAVDIEATNLRKGKEGTRCVFSIGAVCLINNRAGSFIIKRFSVNVLPHGLTREEWLSRHSEYFEENCWNNPANADVLKELLVDPLEPADAFAKFAAFVDKMDRLCDVRLLSDNPVFDFGTINNYYQCVLDRNPIEFKANGEYRPIFDTDSYLRGVAGVDYSNPWTSTNECLASLGVKLYDDVTHDHNPTNDAMFIVVSHLSAYYRRMGDVVDFAIIAKKTDLVTSVIKL